MDSGPRPAGDPGMTSRVGQRLKMRSNQSAIQPLNDTRAASRFALDSASGWSGWEAEDEASIERHCHGCGPGDRATALGAIPLHPAERGAADRLRYSAAQQHRIIDASAGGLRQGHRRAQNHREQRGTAQAAAAGAPRSALCPLWVPLASRLLRLGLAERPHGAAAECAAAVRRGLGRRTLRPAARFPELSARRVRVAAVTRPHPMRPT